MGPPQPYTVRRHFMKRSQFPLLLGLLILTTVVFVLGFYLGGGRNDAEHAGHSTSVASHDGQEHPDATGSASEAGANVVWTCSMHPQIKLPEFGQCPICFMDLIPLKEDGDGGTPVSLRQLTLSPKAQVLAEVEVVPVVRQAVAMTKRLTGKVAYDETRLRQLTAWIPGRIDALRVRFVGQEVTRGETLASLYSPELLAAQAELIQASRALGRMQASSSLTRNTAQRTLQAATRKLELLGLSAGQIQAVRRRGTPSDQIPIAAPFGGVVIERMVTEGAYIKTGDPLFTVADLSRVWVELEAYESDLPWVELGNNVQFTTKSHPGRSFSGEVVFVDPMVDPATRTVRVRLDVDNSSGQLKPGMFVRAVQASESQDGEAQLLIPATAPLMTGKRAVVYLQTPETPGQYFGRQIVLGPRAGDMYVVRDGLQEGDLVVANGAFKIDSALQIQAKPSMMTPTSSGPALAGKMPAPGAKLTEGTPAEEARFDPPYLFAKQLPQLHTLRDALASTLDGSAQAPDLSTVHAAFDAFYEAICAVDPTAISDEEQALLWKELAMLLRNDSFLGKEAEDLPEARRIFTTFEQHYAETAAAFPLRQDGTGSLLDAPPAFQQALRQLFQAYLAMHSALAGDDPAGAATAAAELRAAFQATPGEILSGQAASVWAEVAATMGEPLEQMEQDTSMDALRTAFFPVSQALTTVAASFGSPAGMPVYEMFCSMAFDNQGATWLQDSDALQNPYYGAAMLRCGVVQQQLPTAGTVPGEYVAPERFRAGVSQLLQAYLNVQEALAADDLPTASREAEAFGLVLSTLSEAGLTEEALAVWTASKTAIAEAAAAIAAALSMEDARSAFEALSAGVTQLVEAFGFMAQSQIFEAFCPMAFENKGALWLQRGETVNNPYFGAMMLRCGEIKRPVGASP